MAGHVYIMTNKKHGTLYTGVTSDLSQRVYEHKTHAFPNGFSAKFNCTRLVWYEEHYDIRDAIIREKFKRWRREWKIELIETMNPEWNELYRGMGW